MGRRSSGDLGNQGHVKNTTANDTYIGTARKTAGSAEEFRVTHKQKKAHVSKADVKRERKASKYPYSNGIVVASIVVLALFVSASLYWIVVGLAPA